MKPWIAQRMPFGRWRNLAGLGALVAAACAPTAPPSGVPGLPEGQPMVRVGLSVDTTRVTLEGTTALELLDGASRNVILTVPSGQAVNVEAATGGDLTISTGGETRPAGNVIFARPTGQGFIRIDGRPYRGDAMVRSSGSGRLTAINRVGMEDYLLGVVPYEIGRVGPELHEASKAQAVAARTYAVRYLGRRESLGFDVFATVSDQVYGGAEGEHAPVTQAVIETAGEILTYDDEPIEAFYHSTCAGRTAAIEEVWPEQPRPYLVSVEDINPETGEAYDVTSSRYRWTQRWTAEELHDILQETLQDSLPIGTRSIGEVFDFQIRERTPSGRIKEMLIHTTITSFAVGGDQIRWIFRTPEGRILNSSMFDLEVERGPRGQITAVTAVGGGWGHGIGMCQVGAMGRARAGQDYRTILEAYYPGTEITQLY